MDADRMILLVTLALVAVILSLGLLVWLAGRHIATRSLTLSKGSALGPSTAITVIGYPATQASDLVAAILEHPEWDKTPRKHAGPGLPAGRDGDRG